MNLTRDTNRFLARLLVGLVLFAQGLVAVNVYAAVDAAKAVAVAPAQDVTPSMPCHEKPAPSPGGCLTHCSQADQAGGDSHAPVAAPVSATYWQVAAPAAPRVSYATLRRHEVADTGPPLTIRFCSFLN